MTNLEKKKTEANILRSQAVVADYEIKILEREEEIDRLKAEIGKQQEVIEKNKQLLQGAQNG